MNRKWITKKEMLHLGGDIYHTPILAKKIITVFNEDGKELKFSHNWIGKIACICDHNTKWNLVSIVYEN